MVNHYTLPVAKNLWCVLALLIAPAIGFAQNVTTAVEERLAPTAICGDLVIENISWANETVCDAADGQLYFTVSDQAGTSGETYSLEMDFGTKVKTVSGLTVDNGQLILSGLYPSRYANFVLTRESDDCSSAMFERDYLVEHACDFSIGRTGCGSGSQHHENCDGETITIYNDNISANTYIYTDNDYLGCIALVDHDCDVQMSQRVMCLDANLSAPTPNNGYDYGDVTFTRIVGASNAGYSDLVAERINWIICNGESNGYSRQTVNTAIWVITGTSSNSNQLSDDAIAAINSGNLSGVADDMVFFLPSLSNIQPFVDYMCLSTMPDPPTDFTFTCDDYIEVEVDGSGTDCSASPDAQVNISNPSTVYQVVVEVVYKNSYPGSQVEIFTNDGTEYILDEVDISGASSNVYVYRGLIVDNPNWVAHNSETGNCASNNGFQSLVIYPFRNVTVKRSSSGTFTAVSGYCNLETFTIDIPTDDISRTVNLSLPISEMTTDGRFLTVRAEAGGVTAETTIFGPDNGCCLNIVELVLNDVPGTADEVEIEVDTRSSQNPGGGGCGQSWVIAGLVHADVECPNLGVDYGDAPDSYGDICYTINTDGNQFSPTRFGDTVDNDAGSQSSANADGDDNDAEGDDEDGIVFVGGNTFTAGETKQITVTWSSNDFEGHIYGWADWNGNGVFDDPSERIIDNFVVGSGNNRSTGTHTFNVHVPSDIVCGTSFTRFTIQSDVDEGGPTGNFCATLSDGEDGEVEDYQIELSGGINVSTGPDVSICHGSSVTIMASASNGTAPYTFEWSNGLGSGASQTVSPSSTTTYSVTATDANGCTGVDHITVTVNPNPDVHISKTDTTCGEDNGSATASASGGTSPYTFIWGNGLGMGATQNNLAPGTYGVTVLDANGCFDTGSVTINGSSGVTVNAGDDQTICEGESAHLVAVASGGEAPYHFQWSEGLGSGASKTVSPLVTTTYVVTVTDDNGCTATDEVTVFVSANPLVNIICTDDPINTRTILNSNSTCNSNVYGFFTGSLVTNYTSNKRWDIVGGTLNEYANGTAVGDLQIVNQGDNSLVFNMKVVFRGRTFDAPDGSPRENTQCIGNVNNDDWYYYPEIDGFMYGTGPLAGAIVKIVRRGESFQIGTGANLNNASEFGGSGWNDLEVLAQPTSGPELVTSAGGDYNVKLSGSSLSNDPPPCLSICVGESALLTANVIDGEGVSFLWSTGETTASITVSPTSTTTYGVTITAGDGCTDTDEATVEVNEARWDHVNLGSNVSNCDGDCDGSIIVDANFNTTGEFRIEYTFNGSLVQVPGTFEEAGDITLDGLCAGEYTDITIIGVHTGCEAIWPEDITITEPEAPTVTATGGDAICEGEHVDLSATASGGTPPYTFTWNNGLGNGANQTVSPAVTTTYVVTVTDHNGCTDTDEVVVTVSPNPLVNISCPDDPISLRTISNSAQTCNSARVYGFWTGNLATNYTSEKAWDVIGGSFEEFSNGTAVASMQLINQDDSDLIFNMKVVFRGRTFDPPAGSPRENTQCIGDIDNSDWYYYPEIDGFMTGAGDLTGAVVKIVRRGESFQIGTGANLNDAAAFGASGWNDLEVLSQPNSGPHLNDGAGGDYNVNLSGATLQNTNADCLTLCEGESTTLTANIVEGAGVSFEWSTGETTSSITVMPNTTTTYSVTITAGSGCTDEDEVTVTVNPNPEVEVTGTDALCDEDNGTATANASGGTAPYTYEWNNGGTTETITDLGPGTYSVTVTDANGCTAEGSVTIENIGGPEANAGVDQSICEGEVAMLMATASGGTPPYSFQWNQGLGSGPNQEVMPSVTTNYRVTVTDANGCTDTDEVRVVVRPNTPTAEVVDGEVCSEDSSNTPAVDNVLDLNDLIVSGNTGGTWADTDNSGGLNGSLFTATPALVGQSYTFTYTIAGVDGPGDGLCNDQVYTVEVTVIDCFAALGDFVFFDEDEDGVQDPGEAGVSGVTVQLYQGGILINSTTTNGAGFYSFTDLVPGTYQVRFVVTPGQILTLANVGNDDLDSDADRTSGFTTTYVLNAGETNNSIDAGIVAPCPIEELIVANFDQTTDVLDEFDYFLYAAEARIGNASANDGTFEQDIHRVDPFSVFNTAQQNWTNGQSKAFAITFDPNAVGDNKFVFTLDGITLKLDPDNPPSGSPFLPVFDGLWIFARGGVASAPATVVVDDLVLDGQAVPNTIDIDLTEEVENIIITDANLFSGFTLTGNITASWPGARPANSGINVNVKLGKLKDCEILDCNIDPGMIAENQSDCGPFDPNPITGATVVGSPGTVITYQWQSRAVGTTSWTDIPGATGVDFDPSLTTISTEFRRVVSAGASCEEEFFSNTVTVTVFDEPEVNVGPDLEKCPEDALPIDAMVSGGTPPYTFAWTATGGSFVDATVEDPVYNMMMPGTYTLTLTVTDANGCEASDQLDVTVNPSPSVTVEDIEICAGDDGTLTAVGSGGTPGYTFEWSTGATSASITVSPGATTSYSVTVTDSKGCTASTSATVTVNPNPIVSAEGEDATCGDDNGSATASATGGMAPYTFAWSNGDAGA
ncbi:MAG: SdrD B-like domain-containing protein, partial [Bacteroidota bacterium]